MEPDSRKGFTLKLKSLRKFVDDGFNAIQLDFVCLTVRGPGEILHWLTKIDMVSVEEPGSQEGFVLDVGSC